MSTPVAFSAFARGLTGETAFDVLAVAKRLKAAGKDVIELQIGDSPYESTRSAVAAGLQAIRGGATHYGPSPGLPEFRDTIARNVRDEFGVAVGPENVVVGPGAKVFQQFFCEAYLDPGDAALVFTPHFPTYVPNLQRRGAEVVFSPLKPPLHEPDLDDVRRFVTTHPRAKAVVMNFPHNPTGAVISEGQMRELADIIRGRNVALFSDEPYCHMVWRGRHVTPLAQPGLLDQTMAVYTFSKSYSMSGWRLGYAVCGRALAEAVGKMVNTSLSCTPPFVQLAGRAALEHDAAERDEVMGRFRDKVNMLTDELGRVPGVRVAPPRATFYAFPDVSAVCRRLGITSHGLAMYLLEGADGERGVACLGGECFGEAGQGYLRFSCAEPEERLRQAVAFFAEAIDRTECVAAYLTANPRYRLTN